MLLCLEKAPESRAVLGGAVPPQPRCPAGPGSATLQERGRRSQLLVEAFQAAQLLTALQLLLHAVLLYITLLSLPGGTAVLQYSHLATCKTDSFTSQISNDCCCCTHVYEPSSVLHLPALVHIQGILVPCLQPPSQPSPSSQSFLWRAAILSFQPKVSLLGPSH